MGALGPSMWDICKQTQPRGGIEESGVSGGSGGQSLVPRAVSASSACSWVLV